VSAVTPPRQLQGAKYSPNLGRWLARNRRQFGDRPGVYRDADSVLFFGKIEDHGFFIGARMWGVLAGNKRGSIYAYEPRIGLELTEVEGFWDRYAEQGRCAMDPEHRTSFIGDDTRWQVDGDHRECLWCGQCSQTLRRWTEHVERSAWAIATPTEGIAA